MLVGRGGRMLGAANGHGFWAIWLQDHLWDAFHRGAHTLGDTRSLAFPVGGPLASTAPLSDAISAGLRAFLGPVSAFDAGMLASLALGIGGGWALGRAAGLRDEGALIAATITGFSAFLLTAGLASGDPVVLAGAWTPWVLAAAIQCLRAPGPLPLLGLALSTAALAFSDPQLGMMVALLAPLVLVPEAVDAARLRRWTGLGVLGVGLGFGVAFAASGLATLYSKMDVPFALLPPGAPVLGPLTTSAAMAQPGGIAGTLSGLFWPGALTKGGDAAQTIQSLYIGWVVLGLALLAPTRQRLRWVVLAVGAVILAMGPYAVVAPDAWAPVPWGWWMALRHLWPDFQRVTAPVRAIGLASAGLAVLAGAAVDRLVGRLPVRATWWAALGLSGAILGELAVVSAVPFPLPATDAHPSKAAATLRALPTAGAVLDWPMRVGGVAVQRPFYDQLWHRRPIWQSPTAGADPTGLAANPFVAQLEHLSYGADYQDSAWVSVSAEAPEDGVDALMDMGYAYLVLHPAWLDPSRKAEVEAWLASEMTPVGSVPDGDDGVEIYAFSTAEVSETKGSP